MSVNHARYRCRQQSRGSTSALLTHHEAQAEIHGFSFRPRRRISLEANVFGCGRQEAGHKFCTMSRQKCLDPRHQFDSNSYPDHLDEAVQRVGRPPSGKSQFALFRSNAAGVLIDRGLDRRFQKGPRMGFRVFHTGGPGDIIAAHRFWRRNEHCPTEVTITFSSQFEQFCEDIGAEAYIVGYNSRKEILKDGAFTLEHRPKPMPGARGALYHLAEIFYGLGLLVTAVRFRANVAVIDSGSTYYFVTSLFRLMGIRVIAVLYNTLWPHGFPPTRRDAPGDSRAGFLVLPPRGDRGDRRLARMHTPGGAGYRGAGTRRCTRSAPSSRASISRRSPLPLRLISDHSKSCS